MAIEKALDHDVVGKLVLKTEIHLSKNQVIGRGAEFFNKGQIKKKAMKTAVDFLKFEVPDTIEYHLMDENLELFVYFQLYAKELLQQNTFY